MINIKSRAAHYRMGSTIVNINRFQFIPVDGQGGGWGAPGCFPKSIRFFSFTPVLEIALRTTGDRSFLIVDPSIGDLRSFGRYFKNRRSRFDLDIDLDSRKKKRPVLMRHAFPQIEYRGVNS